MTPDEMGDVVDFFRACLSEDEKRLDEFVAANPRSTGTGPAEGSDMWADARWHGLGLVGYSPERIRASIARRRLIIDGLERAVGMYLEAGDPESEGMIIGLSWVVQVLAEEYDSRPGFQPGWRAPR